jgi:hypothetical protein
MECGGKAAAFDARQDRDIIVLAAGLRTGAASERIAEGKIHRPKAEN